MRERKVWGLTQREISARLSFAKDRPALREALLFAMGQGNIAKAARLYDEATAKRKR